MVVMEIYLLFSIPYLFAAKLEGISHPGDGSANEVGDRVNRKTEDVLRGDDNVEPNGSLLEEIRALKKELQVTRIELKDVKSEVKQMSKSIQDVSRASKEVQINQKTVEELKSAIAATSHNMNTLYKNIRHDMKMGMDNLRDGIHQNTKSISSNQKKIQDEITKNVLDITGIKKNLRNDISSLSTRLTSAIGSVSTRIKTSYDNIQRDMKKKVVGLQNNINKNQKDMSTNVNKLQKGIKKNTADIRDLRKDVTAVTTVTTRLSSAIDHLSTTVSHEKMRTDMKKVIDNLKGEIKKNTKIIFSNTNMLQSKITKNTIEILGLKKYIKTQVTSVSTRLKSAVGELSTKIITTSKEMKQSVQKEEEDYTRLSSFLKGMKKALVYHADIVFYPQGETTHFAQYVYKDNKAHFFSFGWPSKYDDAHHIGDIALRPCVRSCYRMHRRNRRWKAVAYFSEGNHCWCYKNPSRNISVHGTVLLYMYK